MKQIIRDSVIFLLDIFGFSTRYRLCVSKEGPLVRIIAFHDVDDRAWFESIINMLSENYNILTSADFHEKQFDRNKINILLTFDDGYHSWIEIVLPVLKKYGLKAMFFINSGLLDISYNPEKVKNYMRNQLLISPKEPLTWKGAKILKDSGHTIGSHSYGHKNLSTLSTEDLKYEIEKNSERIEDELGITAIDFAYPFGTRNHYSLEIVDEIKNQGYTHQYSALPGFIADVNEEPLKRLLIEKNQSLNSFARWINGGYDVFRRLFFY